MNSSDSKQPALSFTGRLIQSNPALADKLESMALPLHPLVRLTTGEFHPAFPVSLLNFWLLTSEELDDLAHFYHQRTPSAWTAMYPCPVRWNRHAGLEEKRRKLGKFIGLRGCDTPIGELVESVGEIERKVREERWRKDEEEKMMRDKTRWY
ncbi:beta-xylosidase protein [Rutstroemia sp. NJR-2017a WRK4]|nr:beta-xylosidase protein [Rutstroemia sp. NJR-2017a WRK4]